MALRTKNLLEVVNTALLGPTSQVADEQKDSFAKYVLIMAIL